MVSCIQELQEKGYRLTPQRMMVVEALHGGVNHISAEEIYELVRAKYPYANISTVYRTLELLKVLSLVTETELGDGKVRYHPADEGHHHHLICQQCGAIVNLPESVLSRLQNELRYEYDFLADLRHLAVFGLCGRCHTEVR
jgi:Fur family ferric uptake transcriptional regulator